MATVGASRGLGALWKKAWHEIPEVMGSSVIMVVSAIAGFAILSDYDKKEERCRKHKLEYIVVRPDDPRAPKKEQE